MMINRERKLWILAPECRQRLQKVFADQFHHETFHESRKRQFKLV